MDVKAAVLHITSLARVALLAARGRAARSRSAHVRLRAELSPAMIAVTALSVAGQELGDVLERAPLILFAAATSIIIRTNTPLS